MFIKMLMETSGFSIKKKLIFHIKNIQQLNIQRFVEPVVHPPYLSACINLHVQPAIEIHYHSLV